MPPAPQGGFPMNAPVFHRRRFMAGAPLLAACLLLACGPQGVVAPPAAEPASAASPAPTATGVTISNARIAEPPAGAKVAAGYLDIRNDGPDDVLTAVEIAGALQVEIHEMTMDGGMMKMRKLAAGLPLPAGQTTSLAPGGNHLMVFLNGPLPPNATEMAILHFANAPSQTVTFQVQAPAAAPMDAMKMQ
jgi:periplasmic copper chaperone A